MKRRGMLLLSAVILAACSGPKKQIEFSEVKYVFNSVSPMVSSLLKADRGQKEAVLSDMIRRGCEQGFPLVETDPLYPEYVFATFVYMDTTHKHEVEVFGIYEEYRLGDRKFYRLDSTDVYYRSYLFPDDLCLAYRYALADTLSGEKRSVTDPMNDNLSPTGVRNQVSWSVLDLRPDEPD